MDGIASTGTVAILFQCTPPAPAHTPQPLRTDRQTYATLVGLSLQSGLTQLQVAVLQSINLEQCSITDLDNILHSWRLRIGDPPPDVLATIVQLLRPLPAHTPPGAAASHASPASSAPSEAWGATPLPAAGNKLRSANGRTLTSLTQSLLALKVIGPKAAYREVADDLVRAIAAASVRRAEECSFTSLAHLAQALTSCSWGDAAVRVGFGGLRGAGCGCRWCGGRGGGIMWATKLVSALTCSPLCVWAYLNNCDSHSSPWAVTIQDVAVIKSI